MKWIVLWVLILLGVGFLALCAAVNVYGLWDQAAPADAIVTLGARPSCAVDCQGSEKDS